MATIVYVKVEFTRLLENRPSDFGADLKYNGSLLSHGTGGNLEKYIEIASTSQTQILLKPQS